MCKCCSGCCLSCSICCARCVGNSNIIDFSNGSMPQSSGDSNVLLKPSDFVKIGQNLASTTVSVVAQNWNFFIQFQKCAFLMQYYKINFGCEMLSNQMYLCTLK